MPNEGQGQLNLGATHAGIFPPWDPLRNPFLVCAERRSLAFGSRFQRHLSGYRIRNET